MGICEGKITRVIQGIRQGFWRNMRKGLAKTLEVGLTKPFVRFTTPSLPHHELYLRVEVEWIYSMNQIWPKLADYLYHSSVRPYTTPTGGSHLHFDNVKKTFFAVAGNWSENRPWDCGLFYFTNLFNLYQTDRIRYAWHNLSIDDLLHNLEFSTNF